MVVAWVAPMIHVVYKGGALALAWIVCQGKQGSFLKDLYIALVEQGDLSLFQLGLRLLARLLNEDLTIPTQCLPTAPCQV